MAVHFTLPGRTVIGKNALEASGSVIKSLGKKAFVVTGKIVAGTGAVKILTGFLEKWGLAYEVFDGIAGEPTDQMIEAGVKAYGKSGCDFLIAMGGGSPLDSAKAIAAMTVLKGRLADYMGVEIEGEFPPLVLIPTTAGTGSEATKFTVITDTEKGVKMLLKGDALLPDLAVVDPEFTITAPRSVTAATGMDALTHAVESYTSRKRNPLTDLYALDAIRRIFTYLPKAYARAGNKAGLCAGGDTGGKAGGGSFGGADGSTGASAGGSADSTAGNNVDSVDDRTGGGAEGRKAREEMSIAAYEAGICINNASVTLVHGMSRPIGALFHVPHGISNAMILKECLEYVMDGCYERFAAIAAAIGAAGAGTDEKEASEAFLKELERLCGLLNIPTLAQYGIKKEEFDANVDKMARDAMASGSPANTIKEVLKDDLLVIYRRLW